MNHDPEYIIVHNAPRAEVRATVYNLDGLLIDSATGPHGDIRQWAIDNYPGTPVRDHSYQAKDED